MATLPDQPLTSTLDPTTPHPISLQSPADLHHLRAIALRAARQKIDTHLPPSAASPGDELRLRVETLVGKFIAKTFDGVRKGVEVNGLPGPEAVGWNGEVGGGGGGGVEELETYDAELAERVTGMHRRIEMLNAEVADRRRNVGDMARAFEGGWRTGVEEEEVEVEVEMEEEGEVEVDEEGGEGRKAWESAVERLREMNAGGLKTAGERTEEARRVVEALERGQGG